MSETSIWASNMKNSTSISFNDRAGDKIEKIEMGGAISTYVGRERCVQGSGGEA
jgi:hypothetical protein